MKKLVLAIVSLLLSGCAFDTLNDGLPQLVGKPIDAAVDVMGLPNQRMEMGSYTVYVWGNNYSSTVPIYSTNTAVTTGSVGTTPVYGTTTTSSINHIPVQHRCEIKLQVDENEIVRRWEWSGNQGGCQTYASRLKHVIPK